METAFLVTKWVLFVIYIGGSGMLRIEPVATGLHSYQACVQAAREMARTTKAGRFDCTWYRETGK